MEQHSFGYWLKLKRKALDLTREELAKQVGYSAATIRKIEDEERHPSAQVVKHLAEFFQIPSDQRTAFLRFARGDWRAAPPGDVEDAPWLVSSARVQSGVSNPAIHLATFLFTDIEGSAKLWERAPDRMKVALQRHHQILQEAIISNGGAVFQIVGDAFCAAFPTVPSAISAAVTAQRELYQEPWDTSFPIRVRMGIHTGEAEMASNGEYASNQTMNRVARILSAGHGGQVLLSTATKELGKDSLPDGTELRYMGEHHLKNLSHPEHIFQLKIAGLPADFPPLNTLNHRYSLPVQLTTFIARDQDITLVREYLLNVDIRLVTLIGPPGIGKTRLSIEAAHGVLPDFPDGVFFVALAPLNDPSLIAPAIAQALGYVGAINISTQEQLKEGIGDKHMLLVLDNCEHLIEEVASVAFDLLSICPHLKILASSRESLRIPGEWLYPVPPLEVPSESSSVNMENVSNFPALTLFAERARAVRPDFVLNPENIASVTSICAHLDGLPLVIELIAARMRLMSPESLLGRLNDQFILSADGMRAASVRQKTLNNAIGWSYRLLSVEEQKLFGYLSVFSGGFTLESAESIFSGMFTAKSVSDLITSLLDKSLLQRTLDREAHGGSLFNMLVTIQQFARDRLRDIGEETEVCKWHLTYFLAFAEKGDQEIRGPNQIEWLQRLGMMRDNFRAALQWAIETGQTEAALHIARKLHWFLFVRGDHNEGRQWLGRVLALPDAPLYPGAYAEALTQIAHHTWLQSGAEEARPFVEQALVVARAHGDEWNTAKALSVLGLVLALEHNYASSQVTLEESKALFREVDDKWGYAHAVLCLGQAPFMQDDRATALAVHEQALELFRRVGDRYFQSAALRLIGNLEVMQGNWPLGQAALLEALTLAQQLDSKYEIGLCLWSLGYAVQPSGNVVRVVRLYGAAKNLIDSVGAWREANVLGFENDIAPCRAALSELEFATALEEGRVMTLEQAIAYALEDHDN